jgi:long-chain fatty acid transport protein
MNKLLRFVFPFFLLAIFFVGQSHAGGIALYEFGSPDVGQASAGYAARAQDASTVFTNPAGMSRLDKSQVQVGAQLLYGDIQFNPNAGTTVSGTDGGIAVGSIPGGSFFVVQKLTQDLSIGVGALSYFGLSEKYDDNWVGRYYVQKGSLLGMTLTPAVSYRIANWLSVGAGLNAMYGYTHTTVAINNGGGLPDGELKYRDREWGYGGNFGILVEPRQGTRFGLTYLTEVKLDFSAAPEFSGLGPVLETALRNRGLLTNNLDIKITVPQMVMFSAYHELNKSWAVMASVGWQDWSQFGEVDIGINSSNPTTLTTPNKFNDTWHGALGVDFHYSPEWTFSGGVAYDSSAVDNDKRSVTIPMGWAWRFALGAQYAFNPNLVLGAAYEFAWLGDMPVDQQRGPLAGRVSGDYSNANISIFALNLTWKY